MVHISEPAEHVCAILGKRYPTTEEDHKKTGMTEPFDPTRAGKLTTFSLKFLQSSISLPFLFAFKGKRMKLATPVTWETQLSALGNKHTTWEKLIGENKLPFMAMLRNLRNLIITGISPDYHEQILARLTDEKSVTGSRQLPWRFLSVSVWQEKNKKTTQNPFFFFFFFCTGFVFLLLLTLISGLPSDWCWPGEDDERHIGSRWVWH